MEFQEFKERFNKRFKVVADDSALVEAYSDAQSEFKNGQKKPSVTAKEIDKSIKGERKKVEVDEVVS